MLDSASRSIVTGNRLKMHPRFDSVFNAARAFHALLILAMILGCPQSRPAEMPAKTSVDSTVRPLKPSVPVLKDSAEAVQSLEKAGYLLKSNASGQVTELSIASTESIADSLKHLSGVPSVTKALFTGPGVDDEGMENLKSLKRLKDLDLSDSAIGDPTIDSVATLSDLQALRLRRTGVSKDGLAKITVLPKLRAIDLRNSNTGDSAMVHLAKIATLEDIQLEKSKVTDEGLVQLAPLNLKSINFNYCTTISDKTMAMLGKMPSLESLQADYSKVTDKGMAMLDKSLNLRRVRVRGCDVTGEGIKPIADNPKVSRFELRDTSVGDDAMEILAAMSAVTYLDISECRLASPAGIGKLGAMTGLTYLGLWETKANDDTLAQLGGLVNLKELDLKACAVTDASLPTLMKMKSLESLNVAGTRLTDDSFRELAKLPKLKSLNVANTNIGFDVLDELAENFPDLNVIEFEN